MAVLIMKGDKLVSQSKNLRGLLDYARKSPVVRVKIWQSNDQGEGMAYVTFDDGATCRTTFASYRVLEHFILTRRTWHYNLTQLSHWEFPNLSYEKGMPYREWAWL